MLNITGGGEQRIKKEKEVAYLKPNHIFEIDAPTKEIQDVLKKLSHKEEIG